MDNRLIALQQMFAQNGPPVQAPVRDAPEMGGPTPVLPSQAPDFGNGRKNLSALRNILGTLGDAFLVQSGNKAQFAPWKEQQHQSQALEGFAADPLGAVQKLSDAGFPDQARAVYNDYVKQQLDVSQAARQNRLADSTIGVNEDKALSRVGGMASTLNANNFDRSLPYIQEYAKKRGITLKTPPGPGASMEEKQAYADELKTIGTSYYQQEQLEQGDARVATGQRNANSAATNAETNTRWAPVKALTSIANARTNLLGKEGSVEHNRENEKYNRDHPRNSKGSRFGSAANGELPPRRVGDIKFVNGVKKVSKNGKTWE